MDYVMKVFYELITCNNSGLEYGYILSKLLLIESKRYILIKEWKIKLVWSSNISNGK